MALDGNPGLSGKRVEAVRYKIGDVSKILGISPDLVRYYEKKGVVSPAKDRHNDYRYYEMRDTGYLTDCLFYKNFGFSIEETADLVQKCSAEEIFSRFERNEQQLREKIRYNQLLLRRSEEYRDLVSHIPDHLGKCSFAERPECIYYLNRRNQEYDMSPELRPVTQQWLKYLPFSRRAFFLPEGDLLSAAAHPDISWGFSLSGEYADILGAEAEPPVRRLPAQRCVYTIFSCPEGDFSTRSLVYAVDFITAQGMRLCGDACGSLILSARERGNPARVTLYYEAWLPVDEI